MNLLVCPEFLCCSRRDVVSDDMQDTVQGCKFPAHENCEWQRIDGAMIEQPLELLLSAILWLCNRKSDMKCSHISNKISFITSPFNVGGNSGNRTHFLFVMSEAHYLSAILPLFKFFLSQNYFLNVVPNGC